MKDSIKAVRSIRNIPLQAYRLPDDGRQWRQLCRQRREVAMNLATYADPDGSNIYPSAATIARNIGLAERTVQYMVAHLIELGFLVNTGFSDGKHKHSRVRRLNVEKMQAAARTLPQSSQTAPAIFAHTLPQSSQTAPAIFESGTREDCIQPSLEETDREKTDQPKPSCQPANSGRDGREDVRPVGPSTKSNNEKQRWLEFIKLLDEPMRGAWPTPDERKAVLEQLDQIGDAKELAKAINEWICDQSPPITTLEHHRWTRWLETGAADFEECKEYVEYLRKKKPVTCG